jgi:ppGpp synthetase/RelA/SpoT-type nucleotidyltranferase
MTTTKATVDIYGGKRSQYLEFIDIFRSLVQVLISRETKVGLVQVSGHLKSVDELAQEISILPDGSYPVVSNFQNPMVLRVVTYYEKDVALALRQLTSSFDVVEMAIQEKDDPEAHGYPGSTLFLKFGEERLRLEEYKRFADLQIEVQVYSIFQDVWSKIERHIGYPAAEFPSEQLREFSQLAYMLELADSELNNIRKEIIPYNWTEQAQKAAAERNRPAAKQKSRKKALIKPGSEPTDPAEAAIPSLIIPHFDLPSLDEINKIKLAAPQDKITQEGIDNLILSNDLVRKFDKLISDTYNTRLMYQGKNIDLLLIALNELDKFGKTADIEAQIFEKRRPILAMAVQIFGEPKEQDYEYIPKGISLFFLTYYTIAETRNNKLVQKFLGEYSFDENLINQNSVLW